MATNNYLIGQGELMIRQLNDDETNAEEFWALGDADVFTTDIATSINKHYESNSGAKRLAASWNTQTDLTFTMNVKNFNLENLATMLSGTKSASVAGGSIVDEVVAIAAGADGVVYTTYPGISAVSINDGDGITALVENTDYTIESTGGIVGFDGGIRILPGAPNFVGPDIEVSYTHVGINGAVEALTTAFKKYEIRFNAVNMNASSTPVFVEVPVAQFYPAESLSWIGSDAVMSFDFTGDILTPSDGSGPIKITEGHQIV